MVLGKSDKPSIIIIIIMVAELLTWLSDSALTSALKGVLSAVSV